MNKAWPFSFYFFFFAGIAFVSPFLVLYYQELGFSGTQIGLLTGVSPLLTFFSATLWTGFADRTGRHRLLMSLALLSVVVTLIIFPLLRVFAPILVISMLFSVFWAPVSPFADSATMFMIAEEKESYSRIRLGGTIGFGLAAPLAGILVQNQGIKMAFWGCAVLFFLSFLVSQKLAHGEVEEKNPAAGKVWVLLRNPRWLLFLIVAFTGGAAMSVTNNYLFPYLKEMGASESTMGLALMIGVIAEIPILFFGNQLIKRLKPFGLLMLSVAVTGLRLLLFASTDQPNLVLVFQILNGLTFAVLWVAGVSYAAENAPKGMRTSAQGLFSATVMGFGTAAGGFIGGPLLESVGGRGLFFIFGIGVLLITALASLIQKRLPAEQIQ